MGLYISGALGALIAWPGAARVPRHTRGLLIGAALPTAVSLATEWGGVAASSNILRAALALPLGGMAGWVFVRMLRAEGEAEQMRYDLLD